MAAVRASTRVSIAWRGGQAYEDTDTLVLTIHDFSLDLRVFTSGAQKGTIDWATVANVTESKGPDNEPVLKWDHLIDSRPPTGVDDQGTFTSLPNGDVQEHGSMYNPATGDIEEYVETWRRLPLGKGSQYGVFELENGDGMQAWLGKVGTRTLGLAKRADGEFLAYRDEVGQDRIYSFGQGLADLLPHLPDVMLPHWQPGNVIELGGKSWRIRHIGTI